MCGDSESCFNLDGLMDGSKQGDSVVRYIFSLMGIKSTFHDKNDDVPTTVRIQQK